MNLWMLALLITMLIITPVGFLAIIVFLSIMSICDNETKENLIKKLTNWREPFNLWA